MLYNVTVTLLASQMWSLARYLPLLVGDKVQSDDTRWGCFIMLLKITMYCTSRTISISSLNYLEVLIEEHHQAFRKCYPSINMTPKMHYAIHFPRLMRV